MRPRGCDVNERDLLAEEFERHRGRLRAVAYRMLGSMSEAEDAVQEAWLRLDRTDSDAVANPGGWLSTVVARASLDMLRAPRARRGDYLGSRRPGPGGQVGAGGDPARRGRPADTVGLASVVGLDT